MRDDILCELNDKFSACISNNKLDEALLLEKEILSLVGDNNNRIAKKIHEFNPKLIFVCSLNRAIFHLCKDEINIATYCMVDVSDAIFYSGLHDGIYNILNSLTAQRGRFDELADPYGVACVDFMIGILCRRRFPAMSLSFMWKARVVFEKLNKKDIAKFVCSYINNQYHTIYNRYKQLDPKGALAYKEEAGKKKHNRLRDEVWELSEISDNIPNRQLSKKEKELVYGQSQCRVMNSIDAEYFWDHAVKFNYKDSILYKIKDDFDINNKSKLPNILEVIEYICYDEERCAILHDRDRVSVVLYGEAHKKEDEINQIVNGNDEYVFITKGIINNIFYRGQTKYNDKKCFPSLYRGLNEKEVFIERIKLCEFAKLLQRLPSAHLFKLGLVIELPNEEKEHHTLLIDYDGLAQHYGIKTNCLDLTVDKWVAAFFACCDYAPGDNNHRDIYKQHTKDDVGVFYIYMNKPDYTPNGKLRSVCFQPQSRPILQSGYVLMMEENENLADTALGIPFRFDAMCTNLLYGMYKNSYKIQPEEIIEMKAKSIAKENKCFSRDAYIMAHKKFYNNLSEEDFKAKIEEYELEQQERPIVDFTSEEFEKAHKDIAVMNRYLSHRVKSYNVIEDVFDD